MKYRARLSPFELPINHIWLLYTLVISVFLGTQFLSFNTPLGEMSVYRLLTVIIVLYLLFFNFRQRKYLTLLNIKENFQIDLIFIFWLFWAYGSVLWVENHGKWFSAVFFVTFGIISILVISNTIINFTIFKNIIYIVFWMIVLHQIIGLFETIFGVYFFNNLTSNPNVGLGKPLTIFRNINDFSTLIFTGLPISLITLKLNNKLAVKIIAILSILTTVFILMYTGSRANQLALIIFLGLLLFYYFRDRLKIFQVFMIILSVIFLLLTIYFLLSEDFRLNLFYGVTEFLNNEGSNTYRVNMILNGLYFLFSTYGLGVGAGNIEYWMVEKSILTVDAPNIHNWFLDILVAYGIFVFIFYIIFYCYTVLTLYRSYKYSNNSIEHYVSLYLMCYVLSFIVASISSASNIIIEWQWVIWGIIISYTKLLNRYSKNNLLIKKSSTI